MSRVIVILLYLYLSAILKVANLGAIFLLNYIKEVWELQLK